MQANLFTDITANFHKGSETSRAANIKAAPNKSADRLAITAFARTVSGITVKDVINNLGLKHQTASARLTELKASGVLVETQDKRDGCRVLALAK